MFKNFIVVVITTCLTLLGLEAGLRVYISSQGSLEQKVLYLYSREEINDLKRRYRGMPFLNYGLSPLRSEFNSLGYRGDDIEVVKPADTYRIVALGGSTTFGEYLEQWTDAYPYQLQQILATDYDYSQIEVINAGVPGYTTWESAVNFMLRVQDLDPDMIIVYHGINDLNPRLSDPDFYDGINLGKGIWIEHDDPLPISTLYRFVMTRLGQNIKINYSLGEQFLRPDEYRSCGLDVSGEEPTCRFLDMAVDDVLETNSPIYFERNLRNIINMANGFDIEVMLVTWAYSPFEYNIPGGDFMTYEFRQKAVDEHNVIIRQLGETESVLFYDLAQSMPEDRTYWIDGLHMSANGTTEMAAQLADYLVEASIFDE